MTRAGDFADRGVHTLRGHAVMVIETPRLAGMHCHWCQVHGVMVTALTEDDKLLGWCSMAHATLDGLRMPGIAKAPSPAPRRRRKEA